MPGKCPVCGANIVNGACDYCGYQEKPNINPAPQLNYPQQPYPPQPTHPQSYPYQPYSPQPQAAVQPPYPAQPQITIVNQQMNTSLPLMLGISRKSKTVALLLCIFLGYFGAHKFYVGKIGIGILYLCTFGLFGIGWIIDIFVIISGSFRDEYDLPLRE